MYWPTQTHLFECSVAQHEVSVDALGSVLGMSWVLLKSWLLEAKALEVRRRLGKRCRKL